jgi:hypothetical protein
LRRLPCSIRITQDDRRFTRLARNRQIPDYVGTIERLRVSEVVALKVGDIDSARMML